MKTRTCSATALAVLAIFAFAGCTNAAPGFYSADTGGASRAESPADEIDADSPGIVTEDSAATAADRSVITTASVEMYTSDPVATAARVQSLVEGMDGRIDGREEYTPQGGVGSVSLTLRVPSETFDDAIAGLRDIGEVSSMSQADTDVTQQVRDLDIRIESARTSVDRLTELLASASDTETLLLVEQQLSDRTAELEMLLAERADLGSRVEMSTISLWIGANDDAPANEPASFWDGLVTGWNALVAFGAAVLVALGAVLPWLAVIALLALALLLALRPAIRKARAQRLTRGPRVANPVAAEPADGNESADVER